MIRCTSSSVLNACRSSRMYCSSGNVAMRCSASAATAASMSGTSTEHTPARSIAGRGVTGSNPSPSSPLQQLAHELGRPDPRSGRSRPG